MSAEFTVSKVGTLSEQASRCIAWCLVRVVRGVSPWQEHAERERHSTIRFVIGISAKQSVYGNMDDA